MSCLSVDEVHDDELSEDDEDNGISDASRATISFVLAQLRERYTRCCESDDGANMISNHNMLALLHVAHVDRLGRRAKTLLLTERRCVRVAMSCVQTALLYLFRRSKKDKHIASCLGVSIGELVKYADHALVS